MTIRSDVRILVLLSLVVSALSLVGAQQRTAQIARVADDAKTAALDQRLPVAPEITVGKLPNGLRYYIRANKQPQNRAELRLVVNAGSVLEDEDQRDSRTSSST